MFVIFQFIFLLIKILIYASIYTVLTYLILIALSKLMSFLKQKKVIELEFKPFPFSAIVIFYGIAFFIYAFSNWAESGMGDSFKVPIGKGYEVTSIDGSTTYFKNKGTDFFLKNFIVFDEKLCSEFERDNGTECNECFIIFDTKRAIMNKFSSLNEYQTFAKDNHLPFPNEFKDFMSNYEDYWSSRRKYDKWYLP